MLKSVNAVVAVALLSCIQVTTPTFAKYSLVWGPGLDSTFQMPTRYFYVQLQNSGGENFTQSGGDIKVEIESLRGRKFSGRIQVFDRSDGSYVVNYRALWPSDGLKISVHHNDQHLGDSPFILEGWIYQEHCNCPMENSAWLESLQCPTDFELLTEQLSAWRDKSLNMRLTEKRIKERFPRRQGSGAIVHYVIQENRVYRKDVGTITGFKMFTDSIFLSLARKIKLPDVELFFNLGDWPQITSDPILPVFSWCGSTESRDIILPTYDITDASLKSLLQVTLDLLSVQGAVVPNWKDKIPKALFRGRDSNQERLDLVRHSRIRNNSELLDAGITAFFFFPKDESLMSDRIPFLDFFKYKYQINVDGTVAAYRLPYLLAAGSFVLKQDSPYYEHFYHDLEPWIHYVPLRRDLSDVLEKVKWAIENDQKVQEIARNAAEYMREKVSPASIYCYYYRALEGFSKKISSPIEVQPDMEEATHPDYMSQCQCHRTHQKDEL